MTDRKLRIARSSIEPPKAVPSATPPDAPPPSPRRSPPTEADPWGERAALREGDKIEYGVTHEINVDGDKAWVRFGVVSAVGPGESEDQATDRLVSFVNQTVADSAVRVANKLMEA